MKKIIVFVSALVLTVPVLSLAYSVPAPLVVNGTTNGQGDTVFSVSSKMTASFTIDTYNGEAWFGAGDLSQEKTSGYGFHIANNMIEAVSSNGAVTQHLPLTFIEPNKTVNVKADYNAVTHSINVETASENSYSKGIVLDASMGPFHSAAFNAFTHPPVTIKINGYDYIQYGE